MLELYKHRSCMLTHHNSQQFKAERPKTAHQEPNSAFKKTPTAV